MRGKAVTKNRFFLGVQKSIAFFLLLIFSFGPIESWVVELSNYRVEWLPDASIAEASTVTPAIRVESFDQDVTTDGSTFTLNNDVGATSSAFIRINTGTRKTSAGPTGSTANAGPNIGTVGLVLTDTATVTVERVNSTAVKVIGEVWRYEGIAGGANEFVVRDRVEVSLSGSSVSTAVSGVVDEDKVVPFITGYTVNDSSESNWEAASIAAHIDDAGDLIVSRNNSGTAATVYVDVVEFTGSAWTVCHGYSNGHDTAEQTITLNTDSDGQGGSTCDVTDWSTATIIEATMEGDSSETGLSDTLALVRPGADTTSVVFDLQQDTSARNDGEAWMHILQNDDLVVTRASSTDLSEGNGTYGSASWPSGATTTAAFNTLSLEWFSDTSGVGTAHMRGGLHARISDGIVYSDGDTVSSTQYDSTQDGFFEAVLTFAETPSGVIYEAGGTGTGSLVGYNDSGDFVIRAGNGASVSPTDAARIVIASTTYDFASSTGTLTWNFYPGTESIDLQYDEDSNGSTDYSTSTTATTAWANWSGGDDGGVGTSNGNVAGSEITSGYDFNGSIAELRFSQGSGPEIQHWIHRSGNTVGVDYGVIELTQLPAITDTTIVTGSSSQITNTDIPSTDIEFGGIFVIDELATSRNITSITITESGSIDAQNGLDNIEMYYDLDTTAPYDCASESFTGTSTENQYGDTDENGFSGADGSSNFNETVGISPTQTFCGYVVYDVTASSTDGDTIKITINDPATDVVVSNSGSVGPEEVVEVTGTTTVQNAELTMTHYRWLADDGGEGSATAIEDEDTAATGFANGNIRRLRAQIDAAGSTSSLPTIFRLDYATRTAACNLLSEWEDVGAVGGAWDMSDSSNLTDGVDATNIGTGSGGVTDPGGASFLGINGGLRDVNSVTSALTLTSGEFVEFEFAIEPTTAAPQGNTYCFRFSDNGTALRNYDVYAEGTISADIDVSATGTHIASLDLNATGQYLGGGFVIERAGGTRTVTDITLTELGTVDAQNNLSNIGLWYDLDTSAPYDCASESYDGDETQFGATSTSFSSANGTTSFSGSETVNNTRTMCPYVVLSVGSGATNGETIEVAISDPSTEVIVTSSSVGPSSEVGPTGSTSIAGPVLTQTHYHWRNDDGSESGATSATGGSEDTVINDVPKNSTRRLRIQIDNAGSVDSAAAQYRLEYGTKVTTCENVGSWNDVDVGVAFAVVDSTNLTDGNDTTDVSVASGGVTNPGGSTFESPNSGQKDTSSQTGNITLGSTEFVELEFSLEATADAGDETTYCFRVTDAGTALLAYDQYPEFTTREKQDFFVQRGIATITGTATTVNAGTDYTAPSATSAAFVRITNTQFTGAGENQDDDNNATADGFTAYISDASDIRSSFTITRPSNTANSADTRVYWEIVEFTGIAATDNEMIVRDVGEITYGTSNLIATGTAVDTVSDDNDVVIFITGQYNPSTVTTEHNYMLSTSFWHATDTVPVFTRNESGNASRVSYAVVEFTGANWNVQRIENNYSSTIVETVNIDPVTSVTQAFLHAQKRSGEEGLHDQGHEVWLSSMGVVSFQLNNNTASNDVDNPSLHDAVVWVIENTQSGTGAMKVYQSNGIISSGSAEPQTVSVSIGGTIDPDNASIFVTNYSNGEGTAFPRGILAARITSISDYELWQSDTGQDQHYRTEVVEWPVAEISIRQNYYRFYVDNDTLTPTDPWPVGASDLGENESITGLNDPLGEGEVVRIRMSLLVNNAALPDSTQAFKLQFGRRVTSCSAVSSWTDLGAPGGGTIWRGINGTPTDGATLPSTVISVSDVSGTYEEENNTAINPGAVDLGEDIEYDWFIEHNGAVQQSDYCFRMVETDGTELSGYNNYPTIRTTGYTPVSGDWRWYGDEVNVTPVTPLAGTNTTPIDVANQDPLKLRIVATEREGAAGDNVKFRLQYSESADFSDGGTYVTASTSCTATSTWCYADGGGIDNAFIDSAVLATADNCASGIGDGCGIHNESPTTTTTLTQPANSNMEFEFTIEPAGPRVNSVYYFRLYDVTNDGSVIASSSYPSVVTQGGSLTFSIDGVAASTVTEGITTDVTTTNNAVVFDSLAFDAEVEAAHTLTVDTNATEGYQVLVYTNQELLNSYGQTLPGVVSTNAVPAAWSTGCTGGADGCFGYHAGDDSLFGGSTRFAPTDTYAAFSTSTPEEIMYSGQPTVSESTDIIYKIQVSNQQEAGNYQNNIIYLAVPSF